MRYEWNPEKNEWLKKERNISFEQIIFHLSRGDVWKIADHPDQANYPGQKIYFVVIEDCVYLVPYIIEKEYTFLKTIIPSRKATKMYKEEKEG
ncbi:MAG: toxin [Candidatus Aureabacteria bacterium]|nr:toxin [Candidatus Auribacterota bacterium]